jgi:hypothetical protein
MRLLTPQVKGGFAFSSATRLSDLGPDSPCRPLTDSPRFCTDASALCRPPFKKGIERGTPQPAVRSFPLLLPHPHVLTFLFLQSLAEEYSYADAPRPFKNPDYKKNTGRRNKSLKQIIAMERERVERIQKERRDKIEEDQARAKEASKDTMDVDREGSSFVESVTCKLIGRRHGLEWESLIAHFFVSDASVEAPPSILPQKKYCDVTGLEVHLSFRRSLVQQLTFSSLQGQVRGPQINASLS